MISDRPGFASQRLWVTDGTPAKIVLDTQAVELKVGDVVVQRGTNHAWSNRSARPAVVAIASHDGAA